MSRRQRGGRKPSGGGSVQARLRKALNAVNAGDFQPGFDVALGVLNAPAKSAAHADAAEIAGFAAVRLPPEARLDALLDLSAVRPDDAEILIDLGGALCEAQRFAEAEAALREALRLVPGDAVALNNLGQALLSQDQFEAAESCFREALAADADHAGAYAGLGAALEAAGRLSDALAPYRRAVALRPDLRQFRDNLENALRKHGSGFDERERMYRSDLINDPNDAQAASQLAMLLRDTHRGVAAKKLIDDWLKRDPPLSPREDKMLRFVLGEIQLHDGDYAQGWENFASRAMPRGPGESVLLRPRWEGEDITGKSVFVWSEQGVGDEIMFAAMLPTLLARAANVVVESDPRLVPILQRSFPAATIVAALEGGEKHDLAEFGGIDFQVPMGDLGRFLFDDFRRLGPAPFLKADSARPAQIRQTYLDGHAGKRLVGISWNSVNPVIGALKSLQLPAFEPLLTAPGHRFIDLQYGDTASARAEVKETLGIEILHDDSIDQMADLEAFAAQIMALDCVVSVSNTTVHMAAALGVPVFMVLGEAPMWRWSVTGDDSVWYRDLRIFRIADYDDWPALMAALAAAVGEQPIR